jgi:predicted nucleotidyltransferase
MSISTKTDVLALVADHQSQLKNFGVKRLGVFGSFARDEQDNTSDVDMLVEFEPGCKTFDNFMHLAFYLEELFGRKVDLLTPESLSPHLGARILREVEYVALRP